MENNNAAPTASGVVTPILGHSDDPKIALDDWIVTIMAAAGMPVSLRGLIELDNALVALRRALAGGLR